jgi:phage-related protein
LSGWRAPSTTSRASPKRSRDAPVTRCGARRPGGTHPQAKVLKGFGDASVIEIIEHWQGNAYRAVYTVRFEEAVYVLHVFQKKSRRRVETPKADIDLVKRRLRDAKAIHEALRRKEKSDG